jgi:hypothetical protein
MVGFEFAGSVLSWWTLVSEARSNDTLGFYLTKLFFCGDNPGMISFSIYRRFNISRKAWRRGKWITQRDRIMYTRSALNVE